MKDLLEFLAQYSTSQLMWAPVLIVGGISVAAIIRLMINVVDKAIDKGASIKFTFTLHGRSPSADSKDE